MTWSLTPLINISILIIRTFKLRLISRRRSSVFLLDHGILCDSIILISWSIHRLLGCASRISVANMIIVGISGIKLRLLSILLGREQMYLIHTFFIRLLLHSLLLYWSVFLGVLIHRIIWLIECEIELWASTFFDFGFISHFFWFNFFELRFQLIIDFKLLFRLISINSVNFLSGR